MKHIGYQKERSEELVDKVVKLLNVGGTRRKVVFKATTGAGKTVMSCQALSGIVDKLKSNGTNRYEEVAFIWFAPRKLHIQSYTKLKGAFANGRELRPVMFDELDKAQGIQPSEILFVNWESTNKEINKMARAGESSPSLFEVCRRTREENGLPIIAIIDEEHVHWSKTADKSAAVLDRINPAVEIRISATPKTQNPDELVNIPRQEVIDAGMIKKEVLLNANIDFGTNNETELNNQLMKLALAKRQEIADAYKERGIDINPLLLIQLPNDKKESMTTEDNEIAEFVKQYLKVNADITIDNDRLAVWLANEKRNLTGLEEPNNMTQVLLFKEAIALGWDCPRAAVLLIFRKMSSDQFTIQTIGRILRMPEQHHYGDDRLDYGWVYTDIAKDRIEIVTADQSYIKKNAFVATRRPQLVNIELKSVYSERPNNIRNYFGPDFRDILYKEFEKFWDIERCSGSLFTLAELIAMQSGDTVPQLPNNVDKLKAENRLKVQDKLHLDVRRIDIPIPKDIRFQNELQTIDVTSKSIRFTRTAGEIDRVFLTFIASYLGGFERKNNPVDKLAGYLLEAINDFFGVSDTDAKKVVLYHENKPKFDRLIRIAIERYKYLRVIKRKKATRNHLKEFDWSVPEQRLYDEDTHKMKKVDNQALLPFFELNTASTPEQRFVQFLEKNNEYIDWWYKNGDKGQQHYAVEYEKPDGSKHPFYVDFVIRLKNGKIMLFDTKSPESEPITAPLKHNALNAYIAKENADGKNLEGGVIIEDGLNWIWSRSTIANTHDFLEWSRLDFKQENA